MSVHITGIQQVGIGVVHADQAKYLYRDLFGMDVLVFDDEAEAKLMTRYTGNQCFNRRAILTMNLKGGGGFEIWQYLNRTPADLPKDSIYGSPGINAVKIKTSCIHTARAQLTSYPSLKISPTQSCPNQGLSFTVTDNLFNKFQIIEGTDWFKNYTNSLGGVAGVVIGVSNMERSLLFYEQLLGNVHTVLDIKEKIVDNGKEQTIRKVLLRKNIANAGAFSRLLGGFDIELIQLLDEQPPHLFQNRYWGDCGFIHVCFDVLNMDGLKQTMEQNGYAFTVDSAGSYAMENASGRFCYVEDPDGTLIELVQTDRVPVIKKLGWYIHLSNRTHQKPLPNWQVSMLGLNKVK
ncbi:VOC family protein [Sediminibacterium sp.]|jgi:catechol 2,3-dioxygenase-like lactoylglutathione lyase family enzyme|uniref:VOC family protein n=1 Tax=Sediminibacterium sp. TaxID=1917865 RepID=UPI003F6E9863